MVWVYLLRSINDPSQRYLGMTEDLDRRLAEHNAGSNRSTAKAAPWGIVTAIRFGNREKAAALESYLKTGSGWAFANRHLW